MGARNSFTQFDEVIVKVNLDNSLNKPSWQRLFSVPIFQSVF